MVKLRIVVEKKFVIPDPIKSVLSVIPDPIKKSRLCTVFFLLSRLEPIFLHYTTLSVIPEQKD